jgi:uncharacterized protein (DUF1697 family)
MAMTRYLALLRGINVGGNRLIPMNDLRTALEAAGLERVRTYIQSGNVLFESEQDEEACARRIAEVVERAFGTCVGVVVFEGERWKRIVEAAPGEWGRDVRFRHNLIAVMDREPLQIVPRGEEEIVTPGDQVVYQSLALGYQPKPAPRSIQQRMTVRNSNTARRLADLLD